MRKTWVTALGVFLALASPAAQAADHRDGPKATADPASDINDVYAWMSADGTKVYLAMTVTPAATTSSKFSDQVQYAFRVGAYKAFGMPNAGSTNIIATFDASQKIQLWVGDPNAGGDYVTGDASVKAGLASTSGKVRVFAGLRNDPFFFNLAGFQATAAAVQQVGGMLPKDAAGCPTVDSATSMTVVNLLKSDGMGGPGKDFFLGLNTLAIVVAVDKTLLTKADANILSVWGSTHKKP